MPKGIYREKTTEVGIFSPNRFSLTPKRWIMVTNAIGIVSKARRYGGTYAHQDIAFESGPRMYKIWYNFLFISSNSIVFNTYD